MRPLPLPGGTWQPRRGGIWVWVRHTKPKLTKPTKQQLSRAEQRHVRAVREKAEQAMFTPAELCAQHAAYKRGDRDCRATMGERIYQRNKARNRRNQLAQKVA